MSEPIAKMHHESVPGEHVPESEQGEKKEQDIELSIAEDKKLESAVVRYDQFTHMGIQSFIFSVAIENTI
jgi:hypothetical protein